MSADTAEKLRESSQPVLYRCSTVWPFQFFPTFLELTPTKLTIKRMILPFTYSTSFIFMKDLAFVRLSENPFFATLSFEMLMAPDEPQPVRFLHPADAKKIEEMMSGAMEVMKQNAEPIQSARRLKTIGRTKKI